MGAVGSLGRIDLYKRGHFVMVGWHKAACLVRALRAERFGFITTNSLRQTFNRRVLETHLDGSRGRSPSNAVEGPLEGERPREPLSLLFAIPDHPWVENADGAGLQRRDAAATLQIVTSETEGADGAYPRDSGAARCAPQAPARAAPHADHDGHVQRVRRLAGTLALQRPSRAHGLGGRASPRAAGPRFLEGERPREPQEPLTPKQRAIHDQGLITVLRQLHDELDAAVAAAYGWGGGSSKVREY